MISGPSIRLAEVLARNWGNVTFGMEVLERGVAKNGVGFSAIRAFAWDLQTNTYVSRHFEVKHWRSTRSGGYKLTDDRDIYELEANMGSRRLRACILQIIPGDVTSAAVAACRKTSSNGLVEIMKDEKKRADLVAKMLRIYEKLGVTRTDLENYLNAKIDDWNADHMIKLKELKCSFDDGALTLGEVFPHLGGNGKNETITKEQIEKIMQMEKETGRQGEISDALKRMGIARVADIGIEVDFLAIFGTRRDAAYLFQSGYAKFFFLLFLIAFKCFFIRFNINLSVKSINNCHFTGNISRKIHAD